MRTLPFLLAPLLCLCSCANSGLSTYHSPADGTTYVGDFKAYAPPGGVVPDASATALDGIVLLNVQSAYEGEVTAEALSAMIKDVQKTVATTVKKSRPSQMAVNVRLYPHQNPTFQIAIKGETDKAEIQALHETLAKKYRLRSKTRVLGYEFYLKNKKL